MDLYEQKFCFLKCLLKISTKEELVDQVHTVIIIFKIGKNNFVLALCKCVNTTMLPLVLCIGANSSERTVSSKLFIVQRDNPIVSSVLARIIMIRENHFLFTARNYNEIIAISPVIRSPR